MTTKDDDTPQARIMFISGILLALVVLVCIAFLLDAFRHDFYWKNEALLSTLEIIEVMVATFMALILLYGQHEEKLGRTFWMAMGLISMALLNAFSVATRMECGYAWLYSLAGLSGAYWFSNVWLPPSGRATILKRLLPWLVVAGSFLIGIWTVMFCDYLPPMVENGEFTAIAVIINLCAGLFFFAAASRFLIDYYNEGGLNYYLFACISLLFGMAALMFKYTTLWSAQWWFWHLLYLMAYIVGVGFVFSDYLRTIKVLGITIADYKQATQALRENERKFRSLFENSQDAIFISSQEGKLLDINPAGLKLFGYGKAELLNMDLVYIYMNPFDRARFMAEIEAHGFVKDYEVDYKNKEGTRIHGLTTAIVRRNDDGEIVGYQGIIRDVTERKQSEAQIRKSLREKDVMLQEIHHRVKNNLQIISSLLNLQFENIHDEKLKAVFRESTSRIKSMALVHEELYRSQDLARIDFAQYARTLAAYLFRSFGVNQDMVALKMDTEGVPVSIETAVPCGLIVNELVSNSLKYAFDGCHGSAYRQEIAISMVWETGSNLLLTVSDNGNGLPVNLDFRRTASLGLQLVTTLVEQLNGTIELEQSQGTKYVIRFPQSRGN